MTRPLTSPSEKTYWTLLGLWHLGETGILNNGVFPERIAEDVGRERKTVTDHLRILRENGYVESTSEYHPRLGARVRGYRPASPSIDTFPPTLQDAQ